MLGLALLPYQGTGFGYLIACFFFMIINLAVAFSIRADATTHLGSSNGGSDYAREVQSSTTDYNPPGQREHADERSSTMSAALLEWMRCPRHLCLHAS